MRVLGVQGLCGHLLLTLSWGTHAAARTAEELAPAKHILVGNYAVHYNCYYYNTLTV